MQMCVCGWVCGWVGGRMRILKHVMNEYAFTGCKKWHQSQTNIWFTVVFKLCVFKSASSYYCLYCHKKDGIYHLWFTGNALLHCFYPNVWKEDVHKKTSSITFDSLWVRNCDRALVAGAYYPVNDHIWQNLNLFSGKPLQIHIKYDQCTEWKMLL